MQPKVSALLAVGTVATALGIGAAMQYWPTSSDAPDVAEIPLVVTDMQDVSSTPKAPLPVDVPPPAELPVSVIGNSDEGADLPIATPVETPEETGFACDIDMTATPEAGAMMSVTLIAPCHGNERVTLHHNGLMFTDLMQADGSLRIAVPALVESALVIASFMDGSGAVAHAEVTSVPFYERAVLQWRGAVGLQLHAREFDAQYYSDGHIWNGSDADAARAATGEGGFLTTLGNPEAPDPLLAEVYTFPSGMTPHSGTVTLTVEAEIQSGNCNTDVEAQTLELRTGAGLTAKDLTINVPGCDAIGDFLMLKNIVRDLTIAQN
jgi:hypothetical protein